MKRLLVPVLAVALLGSGCQALTRWLRTAFRPPTLDYKTVSLADISLGGLGLDTVWALNNPNSVGLSLASIDYALKVDGHQVVAGAPQQGLQIPPHNSTELHFPANVRFADLGGVLETFLNKDTAAWSAQGHLGIQTPIGVLQVPLSREGTFEVPKVPQVVFGNPRVTGLSLTGATVEFPVTVTNRNSFPLPVDQVSGALSIGGSPVGQLATGALGAFEGKGTRTVALPVQLNLLTAGTAVANAVRGGQQNVQFTAHVQSGGNQVPVRVDQLLQFLR